MDLGVGSPTTYDYNGNIRTMRRGGVDKTYTPYPNTNRVQNTDGSGNDYVYDANGNMITASARSPQVSLTYDVFTNMTTKITETSNGFYQKYQYDARNVRVLRQNYSPSLSSTLYLHGLNDYPLVEKTSSGVERIYIYGATGLIVIKEGSSKLYVQKDHLGSTRVLYNTSGSAETIYEYDAYGKVVARKIGGNKPVYRFTGQEYEEESNLQNFRARMYDDELVTFTQTDPANQNYAPYSYAIGNPIKYVDPTGRWMIDQFSYYTPDQDADAEDRYEEQSRQVQKACEKNNNDKKVDQNGQRKSTTSSRRQKAAQGRQLAQLSTPSLYNSSPSSKEKGIEERKRKQGADINCSLSPNDVDWFWQNGNGMPVYVDLNSIDLSNIQSNYFIGGIGSSQTFNLFDPEYFSSLDDAQVYGNITLTLVNDKDVMATYGMDRYDFDVHPIPFDKDLLAIGKVLLRDVSTFLGYVRTQVTAGSGHPFSIVLMGKAQLIR